MEFKKLVLTSAALSKSAGAAFDLERGLLEMDPVAGCCFLCFCWAVYCFVWSVIGSNVSKVDQIWSITPFFYCWYLHFHYVHNHGGSVHERLLLVCLLTTLWGVRLTYNFYRRGGYGNLITHEEDYRWPILRKKIGNKWLFLLFNLTFIASYQNLILMAIALPAHGVMLGESAIGSYDWVCTGLFLTLLVMETTADQQHWNYHNKKYAVSSSERKVHPDRDVRNGFYQSGLFAFCRHPNYFAEQAMWVVVYAFSLTKDSITKPSDLVTGYALGIFMLITLFQGSMSFSESITAGKYPLYKDYQTRVSQCIPWFSHPQNDNKIA